jgi:hypothetical protein
MIAQYDPTNIAIITPHVTPTTTGKCHGTSCGELSPDTAIDAQMPNGTAGSIGSDHDSQRTL